MSALWSEYWPVIVVAIAIGLLVGWLAFRPRQRVSLSDTVPLRPHMTTGPNRTGEGQGLLDEAAAATSDITGEFIGARVHDQLPGATGTPDPLQQLKGVGPKLATLLNQRGIIRFEQIAKLSPGQVETLDESLGAFRGRFARDRIVEQADYLARGDIDGYEQRFGKL
jgi:predicted flap endonuclease-1-like 5' DNA nuclease